LKAAKGVAFSDVKSKKYPAIVSVHPFDGANEQTAGDWP
jgi:hypothetical protein